jgi:GH43 family beta-xylosidase
MKLTSILFCIALTAIAFNVTSCKNKPNGSSANNVDSLIKTIDIPIRDPYILVDRNEGLYYMYAQTGNRRGNIGEKAGVEVYTSTDLQFWSQPTTVLELPGDFWGGKSVWAPEVHEYNGKYYLFTTLTANDTVPWREPGKRMHPNKRGTQIFYSDAPTGPFTPFSNNAHTPADWMALDGTLWVENNIPYMVFCHEWIQILDGTMELIELTGDLSSVVGEPITLFKATDAPWVRSLLDAGGEWHGYITDGPFIHPLRSGKLLMIWSSFGINKYTVGMAISPSGSIKGPWQQLDEPLYKNDGGHGMLFRALDNKLYLTLHQPNGGSLERARFFEVEENGDMLQLK